MAQSNDGTAGGVESFHEPFQSHLWDWFLLGLMALVVFARASGE